MRFHRMLSLRTKQGFTLLEVMISLSIIIVLSTALSTMLRGNLDMRESLAQRAEVMHRLSAAMQKLSDDITHAYIVPEDKPERYGDVGKRKVKTLFKIELRGEGDELWLTANNHKAVNANSNESDTTFIVYKLQEAKDGSGRTHLYRAEAKRIPESFTEELPMKLLAKGIKSLRLRAWRGDEWSKDQWDSEKRDMKDKLPRMVSVELDAWSEDPYPGETFDPAAVTTTSLRTVVHLANALNFAELKQGTVSIRWDRLGEKIN